MFGKGIFDESRDSLKSKQCSQAADLPFQALQLTGYRVLRWIVSHKDESHSPENHGLSNSQHGHMATVVIVNLIGEEIPDYADSVL